MASPSLPSLLPFRLWLEVAVVVAEEAEEGPPPPGAPPVPKMLPMMPHLDDLPEASKGGGRQAHQDRCREHGSVVRTMARRRTSSPAARQASTRPHLAQSQVVMFAVATVTAPSLGAHITSHHTTSWMLQTSKKIQEGRHTTWEISGIFGPPKKIICHSILNS